MLREIARGELYILYPRYEGLAEVARLGFTKYKLPRDIARHSGIVAERICEMPDCRHPLQTGKPHGWTCLEHDPVVNTRKRQGEQT
jgi:hypothetical protein